MCSKSAGANGLEAQAFARVNEITSVSIWAPLRQLLWSGRRLSPDAAVPRNGP